METAKQALRSLKPGHATILWDRVVLRRGDKYVVGETINVYAQGVDIEEAARILKHG